MDNYIFWSEIGSGFEEPGGTPPAIIPRSTTHPPPPPPAGTWDLAVVRLRGDSRLYIQSFVLPFCLSVRYNERAVQLYRVISAAIQNLPI